MHRLQRYLYRQLLWPLTLSCLALAGLALLTQSLSNVSLIVDEGESLLLVLKITALTLPQLMGLVVPIALYIAVVHGLHRLNTDSELVVAATSGLSRWGVIAPVLRLTALVMAAHLALGLWLQPFSYREMRRTLHDARIELASSVITPGEFTRPSDDLTIFVREFAPDGSLSEVFIEDARDDDYPIQYLAERGVLVESATAPTLILYNASLQTIEEDGRLSFLDLDTLPFDLSNFIEPPGQLLYKLSDRYLSELFFANPAHFWERENAIAMRAEGHSRLSMPLYDLALAAIAALALLGGDFSRNGYGRRIAIASVAALTVRLAGFAIQSGAETDPRLNIAQYAFPLAVAVIVFWLYFHRRLAHTSGRRRKALIAQISAPA